MKAQVKGTNIIFDVEEVGDGGVSYDIRLVEFIDSVAPQQTTTEPDWEQIKIQAAIQIYIARFGFEPNNCKNFELSVSDADSLITELKKQKQ